VDSAYRRRPSDRVPRRIANVVGIEMLHVMGEARNELTRVDEEVQPALWHLDAARGPSTPTARYREVPQI